MGCEAALRARWGFLRKQVGISTYHKERQRTPNANHSQAKNRRDSESFSCDDQYSEIPVRRVHFLVFPTRQLRGRGIVASA